ncbi:MAG: adenylate/guanylate cyclase domain-containing protein [Myxococcota bacterium]
MDPKKIRTARDLLDALDQRGRGDEAESFDQAVWKQLGTEGTVLVTDLSGFTRLTRNHGILHFLQIFRRCENVCLPLIAAYGGTLLKEEADDLIGLFASPTKALECAAAMLEGLAEVNATLAEEEHIGLCIGIDHGRFIRLDDDAFGDPVNTAFKLGEDVADRDEILIAADAFARAKTSGYDFSRFVVDGPRERETGSIVVPHYALRLRKG